MAYYGHNPMPVTQDSLNAVLRGDAGLCPSLPRDRRCVFAWAPYSKLKDRGALLRANQGSMQCSSYYARSGLVHKDKLHAMLQAAGSELALPTVPVNLPENEAKVPAADRTPASTAAAADATKEHVHKDLYAAQLLAAVSSAWLDLSKAIAQVQCAENSATAVQHPAGPLGVSQPLQCAVLKHSRTNNAFDVHIVTSAAETCSVLQSALARQASGEAPAPVSGTWCLQQHCPNMLLVDGCKWTVRANMLCVGRLAVFLHEHVVCHVASVPLAPVAAGTTTPPPPEQHITNHSVQHCLPTYRRDLHTILLSDLLSAAAAGQRSFSCLRSPVQQTAATQAPAPAAPTVSPPSWQQAMASLGRALAETVGAVFGPGNARWFMPTRNNFEVFGVDLLPCVSPSGTHAWRVLEVNEGPALEALAMPPLNRDIVRDTVALVSYPWLQRLQSGGAAADGAEGNEEHPEAAGVVTEGGGAADEGGARELQLASWLRAGAGDSTPSAAQEAAPAAAERAAGENNGWILLARTAGGGDCAQPFSTGGGHGGTEGGDKGAVTEEQAAVADVGVTQRFLQHVDGIRAQLRVDDE